MRRFSGQFIKSTGLGTPESVPRRSHESHETVSERTDKARIDASFWGVALFCACAGIAAYVCSLWQCSIFLDTIS